MQEALRSFVYAMVPMPFGILTFEDVFDGVTYGKETFLYACASVGVGRVILCPSMQQPLPGVKNSGETREQLFGRRDP
jgi:hypothetical protein